MDKVFLKKNRDVTVKLNGAVLGGVKGVTCKDKNNFIDISVFLTDVPEHRIARKSYTLIIETDCIDGNPLTQDDGVQSIELLIDGKVEKYSGCTVEGVEKRINADGTIESVFTVSAQEREVL